MTQAGLQNAKRGSIRTYRSGLQEDLIQTAAGALFATGPEVLAAFRAITAADVGSLFATNAIVLGTAAAAGAATTTPRSNDTIAAFDTTAPTTQAFGDTATVGTAAFAARRDHLHAEPTGVWTTVSFTAGDFTSTGGSWTVAAGDVASFEYLVLGKLMLISWNLATTTVGAGASQLLIKIPGGKTANKRADVPCFLTDNGTVYHGQALVQSGQTNIIIIRRDGANFAAATDNTQVGGQIWIETQ